MSITHFYKILFFYLEFYNYISFKLYHIFNTKIRYDDISAGLLLKDKIYETLYILLYFGLFKKI